MIGKINISGHIGPSFVDATGKLNKGTELLDVVEQVESLPKEVTTLEVLVNSPGGYADIGDSIYEYLVSLKKQGKKIVTVQKGLVGSIATKIFLAGDERLVDDRYKYWIHNPYMDQITGDQDQLRAAAASLEKTEKDLRKFYSEFTSITDEGLDGLMKIETGLSADQCIKFGFATGKVNIPVFNTIKMSTKPEVKKEDENLKDQILALLGIKKDNKKGVQPKAAIPTGGAEAKKSLIVTLAEGAGKFYVEAEALVEGASAFTLDEAGEPTADVVQDGVYNLDPKGSVTISGGKISKVELPVDPAEEEEEEEMTEEKIDALVEAKLKAKEEALEQKFEALTLALKKETKLGVQPKPAVLGMSKDNTFKSITQIQAERALKSKTK